MISTDGADVILKLKEKKTERITKMVHNANPDVYKQQYSRANVLQTAVQIIDEAVISILRDQKVQISNRILKEEITRQVGEKRLLDISNIEENFTTITIKTKMG